MTDISENNSTKMEGLSLRINKPYPLPPNPNKCIICQKDDKKM